MHEHVMVAIRDETPSHFEHFKPAVAVERSKDGSLLIFMDGKLTAEFPSGEWRYWVALAPTGK